MNGSQTEINDARTKQNNFTRELFNKYSALSNVDSNSFAVLEEVNLVAPENIHINAFMYEPLIDLAQEELIDLYSQVKQLP